jgi:hypothetical protein
MNQVGRNLTDALDGLLNGSASISPEDKDVTGPDDILILSLGWRERDRKGYKQPSRFSWVRFYILSTIRQCRGFR